MPLTRIGDGSLYCRQTEPAEGTAESDGVIEGAATGAGDECGAVRCWASNAVPVRKRTSVGAVLKLWVFRSAMDGCQRRALLATAHGLGLLAIVDLRTARIPIADRAARADMPRLSCAKLRSMIGLGAVVPIAGQSWNCRIRALHAAV
jgi:hypothetical protein